MKWLAKGARLVDPALGLDDIRDFLVENGKIAGVEKNIANSEIPAVDLAGKIVVPGFFDMHVHLREPGGEDKETILTGTRAAARGGFTAVACMPNTNPPLDNAAVLAFVIEKSRSAPCRVYPVGCVSKGREGRELAEMARAKKAGAVAFSDDGKPVKTADLLRRALEYGKMLGTPVIDHCEEETLAADGAMHEGYDSTMLGLAGVPAEAETIIAARDLALAELTGGKIHLAHLSAARSVELLREAKSRGVRATGEVTIHHLLLTEKNLTSYDTRCKINPPLRSEADRAALLEGLRDGTIDCLVSDHAPHTREDKEVEFDLAPPGISGVEILVPLVLSEFVKPGKLPLQRLVEVLSINPRKILGLEPLLLQEGKEASFTVIDLEAMEKINVEDFESKGKNSPYDGKEVRGLPVMTVTAGNAVMENRKIISEWIPRKPGSSPAPLAAQKL